VEQMQMRFEVLMAVSLRILCSGMWHCEGGTVVVTFTLSCILVLSKFYLFTSWCTSELS